MSAVTIDEPARSHRYWRRWVVPGAALAILTLVLALLHRELEQIHLRAVLEAWRAITPQELGLATVLTLASYLVLGLFDVLALRYVGARLDYWRAQLTSFIAFAFGHNLSLAAMTGAAVRFRLYSTAGLSAANIAPLATFCSLTSGLGFAIVAGSSLLFAPTESATLLHTNRTLAMLVGVSLLAGVFAYALWGSERGRAIEVRGWSIASPGLSIVAPQLAVATVDLLIASMVLWTLLPNGANVDFVSFAGVYALACVAAIVSHVPAGLGVFESVFVLAMPQVPAEQLLGSLLAYRIIYYLLPLTVAAIAFASLELTPHRTRLAAFTRAMAASFAPIVPQVTGGLVFVAGCVLLLSGATPEIDTRLRTLRHLLPLPVLEISHLAGSVIGLGLLILARALFRRSRAAYHVAFWLLVGGMAASLLKGLDVEEAAFLGLVLIALRSGRTAFYRPSTILSERFTPVWIMSIVAMVGVAIWIGFFAHRHVEYSNSLWWTFALHADAPRMLRAALAVSLLAASFFATNLLQPPRRVPSDATPDELTQAKKIVARSNCSIANAALAGDKRLLFSSGTDGFLMYQVSGRSWISLGDPIGPSAAREELVWRFREMSDRDGGRTVFYQVSAENLPLYIDLGLAALKLGEEARVPLGDFSVEGSARADLRQARRRAERDGASFKVLPVGFGTTDPARTWAELRAVSDAWLADKATAEKGFSIGTFDEAYLANFPIAVVSAEERVVAFANLWTTESREELSIDLMRFTPDAPRGAMDYLFIELMLWGRTQGYRWFNLGVAPLAGLEDRPLAPAWHRIGNFVFRHGEHFYNFDGLRRYKTKFDPVWQPRYLVSPGGLALPRVLTDVSVLIAGGLRELVAK